MPRKTRRYRNGHRDAELILRQHGIFHQFGGGGVKCPVRKGTISVEGHTYRYRCEEEDNTTLIYIGGNSRPCFVLHIFPDTNTAILADIVNVPKCAINTDAPAKAAGLAAFALAKERGVSYITLVDNSSKRSPNGNKFSVAETSFLTTGKTWYESFLPIRPVPTLEASLEQWRHTVITNTWNDVFKCLGPDIQIPVDISDIDVSAVGSAQLVFRRIKAERTDFFADYRYVLPKCSGIGNLHGSEWGAYLT